MALLSMNKMKSNQINRYIWTTLSWFNYISLLSPSISTVAASWRWLSNYVLKKLKSAWTLFTAPISYSSSSDWSPKNLAINYTIPGMKTWPSWSKTQPLMERCSGHDTSFDVIVISPKCNLTLCLVFEKAWNVIISKRKKPT